MPNNLFSLSGKVALVTGAAGGIGQAIANTYADQGAAVILSDLRAEGCQAVADSITENGGQAIALTANLAEKASLETLFEKAIAWRGHIDSLVCCGGMEGHVGNLLDVADDAWDSLLDVNLRSALWLSQLVAASMRQKGGGNITYIASIAGLRGNRAIGLYGIAKAGLSQLARNLAVELGPANIRVNAVAPGLIETPFSAHLKTNPTFMERRLSLTPLRRMGQPEEISGLVTMLASAAGGFITGQTIVVDGGTLITDGN